jgi:hypothetical protein
LSDEASDYERAVAVLRLVLARTMSKGLDWEPLTNRSNAFDVTLPSGTVEVGTADNDGVSPFDFRIYSRSPEFELVHRIDTRENPELSTEIERLWRIVKRQVSGVDATLEGLLRDLGDIPPF